MESAECAAKLGKTIKYCKNVHSAMTINKICFTLDPLFKNKFKILLTLHLLKATTKNSNPPC